MAHRHIILTLRPHDSGAYGIGLPVLCFHAMQEVLAYLVDSVSVVPALLDSQLIQ